jgi:DNA-binding PadR family transcriptional regulator
MNPIDQAVLTILATKGQGNWYTLDRDLTRQGLLDHGNLARVAKELADRGYIVSTPTVPGMATYAITEAGRRALAQQQAVS